MSDALPIDAILPDIVQSLRDHRRIVLEAPPGAGKTTRVPLALLEGGFGTTGKIIMLEPRRLAARAAATRMAQSLSQDVGQTVGYRIKGEAKTTAATQIEVVTEGILTRMLQSDPELAGVSTVIFDEFHERSLHADMGLALCLEVAEALRDDLNIVVMSATLDAGPIAEYISAPIIRSEGRSFPVDITYLGTPPPPKARIEDTVTRAVLDTLPQSDGALLVFLPGEGEIRRVMAKLSDPLDDRYALRPLYGNLPYAEQQNALRPDETRRKIVLATSIAETSLTIPDIRVVIDSGLTRRARFDPARQMNRLVTERATRAEADQRAGRAGRVAAGRALRLWTRGAHGALAAHAPAEIEIADLTEFTLQRALWSGSATGDLRLLTPPPSGAMTEAITLLTTLSALGPDGTPSAYAKALAALPLHPRLGHALLQFGADAAPICALLNAGDPLRANAPSADGLARLEALHTPRSPALSEIAQDAKRLHKLAPSDPPRQLTHPAEAAALAYPDQIAQRRSGDDARYLLSNGKGAMLPNDDALANAPYLIVTNHDGAPKEAKIRMAFAITEAELRDLFAAQITTEQSCSYAPRQRKVIAQTQERLGALILSAKPWKSAPAALKARAMCSAVPELGLPWNDASRRLAARIALLPDRPDMSDAALIARAEEWLLPYISGIETAEAFKSMDLCPPLLAMLPWDAQQSLNTIAPAHYTTPLGRKIPIDYSGEHPQVSLRLQEVFGETRHPTVAGRPLRMILLSPAGRPVQTTMDLPQFWISSYADVRKDMRGRYPKHPWPEDPREADPTLRAKPRKS